MSEQQLLKSVLQALTLRRVLCWRVNSGTVIVGTGLNQRAIRGAPAGSPDIMLVIGNTGQLGAIEVKTEKGKQLASQRRWQERAEKHGVRYGVARSVSQALGFVDTWSRWARGEA